jgi:EAL domain-containing protein (putative c-di-GMP-specific phosphodiesterase class I)
MEKINLAIRQSNKINLILLIAMAFVMVGAYFDKPSDGLGAAKRLAVEVVPLLSRGDAGAANELIKNYADINNINKIKLFDIGGNIVVDYSNLQGQDEFSLANHNGVSGAFFVDWPLYSGGAKIGRIEVASSESGGIVKHYFFAMFLLLAFGFYANRRAFYGGSLADGFQLFNSEDEKKQSRLFLQNAFDQMGLSIHFTYLKRLRIDGPSIPKKYSSVCVKWMRGANATYFSIYQISELMSRSALILPITPWIYREFFIKQSSNMGDDVTITSFDISLKQFMDNDFRDFVVKLADSLKVPLGGLRIEIDEVALSRLSMEEIQDSWVLWDDAGVGIMVSNFGKTSLSKRIVDNFNPKEIKWCLSWLRYQCYSNISKDRIIELKQIAANKGIESVVYGALTEHDEDLMGMLEFDWLEESLSPVSSVGLTTKAIPA